MIRLAVDGEEIVITQAGQSVAKLTGIARPSAAPDRQRWLESLRQLRERTSTSKPGKSGDEILAEDRAGCLNHRETSAKLSV